MNVYLERMLCYRDTQARARAHPPPPASVKLVWTLDLPPLEPPRVDRGTIRVSVQDMDSIDCGLKYLRMGHNPVVMNLADDCWPGGCVETGSGAQEESLFRRTNLCSTLTLGHYPIHDDELVYSPGVTVLKSSEATGWLVMEPPLEELAFISCPGIKFPQLDYPTPDSSRHEARLRPIDEDRLRVKLRLILRCAALRGHDAVIMGALGCGAWKNPAPHVADVYAEVLAEPEFRGHFAHVVIAVLRRADDMYIIRDRSLAGKCRDNYDVFADRFRPGRTGGRDASPPCDDASQNPGGV